MLNPVEGTIERSGRYHLNIRVPAELVGHFGGKEHLRRSLKTSDAKEAEREVLLVRAEFERELMKVRGAKNWEQELNRLSSDQRALFDKFGTLDKLLDAYEETRMSANFAIAAHSRHTTETEEELSREDELRSWIEERHERAFIDTELGILRQLGKTASRLGADVDLPSDLAEDGLHELVRDYREVSGADEKVMSAYENVARRFVELHGDVPLKDIEVSHLREYVKAAAGLPKSTRPDVRSLSFRAAISRAKQDHLETIGEKTVRKHEGLLKRLMTFAVERGYVDESPFAKFKSPRPKVKHSQTAKARKPFQPDQVQMILTYTKRYNPWTLDRWAPWLAAYQGMRREEIGQLRCQDIRQIDGVWALSITDAGEGQKLKNLASLRTIPIHPVVIDEGFLEILEGSLEDRPFLFREMPRRGPDLVDLKLCSDGRLTEPYGKRFARVLRTSLQITDRALTFHSFRHRWEDAAERANLPQTHRRVLAGRSGAGDSQAGYGDGPGMMALLASLTKIRP
ncbi:MAG: site-specific integrase [Pseudomonadota bacterium]